MFENHLKNVDKDVSGSDSNPSEDELNQKELKSLSIPKVKKVKNKKNTHNNNNCK